MDFSLSLGEAYGLPQRVSIQAWNGYYATIPQQDAEKPV
jgi:hypothetical protein